MMRMGALRGPCGMTIRGGMLTVSWVAETAGVCICQLLQVGGQYIIRNDEGLELGKQPLGLILFPLLVPPFGLLQSPSRCANEIFSDGVRAAGFDCNVVRHSSILVSW